MVIQLLERDYQRILLIKPSSLGDVTHALPILEGLRTRFPNAQISWQVSDKLAGLVEGHPALDEVIPFARKYYGRIGRSPRATVDFCRYVIDLRRRRFDLVVDLQGLFRSGFFAWASRAKTRIGPAQSRECAWIFYNHPFTVDDPNAHAVDRYWAVAEILGFEHEPKRFRLPIGEEDRSKVTDLLKAGGIEPAAGYAVVFPGARWETKVWPADRFAAVVDRLGEEFGLATVVAGSPDEQAACRAVIKHSKSDLPLLDVCGRTTLREASALIEGARLAVTNDSGPMHMADAVGTPLIAVFGPTNPNRTGPYHQRDGVVSVDLDCNPCYRRKLDRCPRDHACLLDITVDRVMERAAAKLTEQQGSGFRARGREE